MDKIDGKTIWIIGASSGIGEALAIELAKRGANLILSARSKDGLNTVKSKLESKNSNTHHAIPFDVSDLDDFKKAGQSVTKAVDHVDSVIDLAAIYDPAPLRDMDIKAAHKLIDVNIKGMFNAVHIILPILKTQGYGQFALCGSVAGYCGLPNGQPYSATKAAVINLAQSLRAEEPDLDIKVINPGFVRTPLTDKNDFKMPMMIEPEDAARAITQDLLSSKFEIHFPKRFTLIMKALALLPSWFYFKLLTKSD